MLTLNTEATYTPGTENGGHREGTEMGMLPTARPARCPRRTVRPLAGPDSTGLRRSRLCPPSHGTSLDPARCLTTGRAHGHARVSTKSFQQKSGRSHRPARLTGKEQTYSHPSVKLTGKKRPHGSFVLQPSLVWPPLPLRPAHPAETPLLSVDCFRVKLQGGLRGVYINDHLLYKKDSWK